MSPAAPYIPPAPEALTNIFSPLQTFTTTQSFSPSKIVSADIASRQEKLEKYRQKRIKRTYCRSTDPIRRERAYSRTRDEFGHFVFENSKKRDAAEAAAQEDLSVVINQLEASKRESMELKQKLQIVLHEMLALRKKAEEVTTEKAVMQQALEEQKKMNEKLLQENRLLWDGVPINEIFSTIRTPHTNYVNVEAFKEKIDLTNIELNWTHSPHLEAARLEEEEFQKRWDEMTFVAGERHV